MSLKLNVSRLHPPQIEKLLSIIDLALRNQFPNDFYKRCVYAAFGLRALIRDSGFEAQIVGGNILVLVVGANGNQSWQGFASENQQCSHFWVETNERLIDVGPHYLVHESSFDAAEIPAIAWIKSDDFPSAVRYEEKLRFPANALISDQPDQVLKCEEFVSRYRALQVAIVGRSRFPSWVVTGRDSLAIAANKGNPWARCAQNAKTTLHLQSLPF